MSQFNCSDRGLDEEEYVAKSCSMYLEYIAEYSLNLSHKQHM